MLKLPKKLFCQHFCQALFTPGIASIVNRPAFAISGSTWPCDDRQIVSHHLVMIIRSSAFLRRANARTIAIRNSAAILAATGRRNAHDRSNGDLKHSETHSKTNASVGDSYTSLLPPPSWSISSLLPDKTAPVEPPITPEKLRHLLRLSALPEPESPEEEAQMLADLHEQLHFVKHMQQVNVEGVEPLQAIRDETVGAELEAEVTIEKLKYALGQEELIGKHYKRLRRKNDGLADGESIEDKITPKDWDPLKHAQRTIGRYFVVDRNRSEAEDKFAQAEADRKHVVRLDQILGAAD